MEKNNLPNTEKEENPRQCTCCFNLVHNPNVKHNRVR